MKQAGTMAVSVQRDLVEGIAMIRQPIITVLGHVDHGKCVAKGTKVFLADGSILPIEEIFEKALQNGKQTVLDDGIAVEPQNPIFVFGEENNKTKKMLVSHVWKLQKDQLVRIHAENGFKIETTPEHPFPILNEQFGISYVKAADLSERDFVLVPKALSVENENPAAVKEIILERLKESDFLVFIEDEFSKNLKRIACINSGSVYYDNFSCNRLRIKDFLELTSNRFATEEVFCAIETVKQSTRKWHTGHTSKKIRLPKTNEELKELFYFAGLFFGDGDNCSGGLCNNDLKLLEFYRRFSEKVLGIPCVVQKGHTSLEAFPKGGKTLVKFLDAVFEIPAGKKSATIRIPKAVMLKAPNHFASAFIRGYFDTDGYVDLNNGVEVSSNSKEMIEGLAFLLLRFGVRCFVRKNKNAYRLTIKGRQSVQNFAEKIGFALPAKKNLLEEYLKITGTSRVLDATPISGKQARQLRKEFGIGNKLLKIPYLEKTESYPTVSYTFLQLFETRLRKAIKEKGKKASAEALNRLENLSTLVKGDLAFSKIVKKELVENEYGFVFDLTQPRTHNFVANGFLVHNTLLLDKIRGTAIAEKEAGAITQHIGATEVPLYIIDNIASHLLEKYGFELSIPGLLFIDTPGHEAFTSLRERGSSIADLAVLVVDITQGFQPQTVEAIEILKSFKTPFVMALNKIDLLYGWDSKAGEFSANILQQSEKGKKALDEKVYTFVGKMFELGFQSERFDRCSDFTKQIPIVPLSAKTGEGLPELLMLLAGLSQRFLKKRLEIHEADAGKGTIIEVKEERGLGKTIDVILYDGIIRVNDTIVLGSRTGIIETKVRALLKPKPLKEIHESGDKFNPVKEAHAACGIKIAAPSLDNALAGAPIAVAKTGNEKYAIEKELASIRIETESIGAVLRADTLGALEALTLLLKKEGLKAKKADVGNISKNDVVEAASVKEKDELKGIIFGFNVKFDEGVLDEAKKRNVKIFTGNVVYRLLEEYKAWVNEIRTQRKKEKLSRLTMPAKLRFLPNCIFRHSKPAVIGIKVLEGKIRPGIKVMDEKGKVIGRIEGIQSKNENIGQAAKGQEVAISIDRGIVGRNLRENEVLFSHIPRSQFAEFASMEDALSIDEKELMDEIKKIVEKRKEDESE